VSPGKRVRTGDALVEIYDTASLLVRALVPSRYLPAMRRAADVGQPLRAEGRAEGLAVSARLLQLAGVVEGGTGGVEGLFRIEEGGEFLQQGRFVHLDLALPPEPGLISVPHEAIYGTDRVYRVDEQSRLRAVQIVRLGEVREPDGGSRVLITSEALAPGDTLVTTQLPNAIDGLLVRLPESN
jgi:multidrug efflux pump subunit AcrA (membrane-fusion protein)